MHLSIRAVPRAAKTAPIEPARRIGTTARQATVARLWQPIVMAAILALVGGFGVVLARAQVDDQVDLQSRFHNRLDLAAHFATAYDADMLAREASVSARRLGGQNPSATEFQDVMADFGFESGMLLDFAGRAIQIYPAQSDLVHVDLSGSNEYLGRAIAGEPAISNVVISAVRKLPVIAFAAPFDTAAGRRVFSGTFDVSTTPLSAHLETALPYEGGEVYLVDASGVLVASNLPADGKVHALEDLDPGIGAATAKGESGRYQRDGSWRWFTTSTVSGSSLTMVASVPEAVLYAPVQGPSEWLPWVVIVVLAFGSLYTVHVLFALHGSREDYLSLARVDPLTGVSNRRELSGQAERVLNEARGRQRSVAVLMIDLDRFKAVNDSLGHEAGDQVLRVVTVRMRRALRSQDLLGRWGGDEFVAILPATTMDQALLVAERVRAAVAGAPIELADGQFTTVMVSVGCAITTNEGIDGVLGRADGAMYGAKRSGDAVMAALVQVA